MLHFLCPGLNRHRHQPPGVALDVGGGRFCRDMRFLGALVALHDAAERIAGNMAAPMARQRARIDIIAPADAAADDDVNVLAPIEVSRRLGRGLARRHGDDDGATVTNFWWMVTSFWWLCMRPGLVCGCFVF